MELCLNLLIYTCNLCTLFISSISNVNQYSPEIAEYFFFSAAFAHVIQLLHSFRCQSHCRFTFYHYTVCGLPFYLRQCHQCTAGEWALISSFTKVQLLVTSSCPFNLEFPFSSSTVFMMSFSHNHHRSDESKTNGRHHCHSYHLII